MNINILYFASLAETLGVKRESLNIDDSKVTTVNALKQRLMKRGPEWQSALSSPSTRCALNQDLVDDTHALSEGCDIAFFPPVTGG